jgi:membrane glycosyltransferase
VLAAFSRWKIQWKSPPREDSETTWREASKQHGWHTLLGVLWAGGVYWLNPSFLWWLLPVVGALMVSIPLSVYTSRVSLGRRLRKARLFVIPEEFRPPEEIRAMMQNVRAAPKLPGFIEAVVDPAINALTCAAGVARFSQTGPARSGRQQLVRFALQHGPAQLSTPQKIRLLSDPLALSQLHLEAWTAPESHALWRDATASSGIVGEIIEPPPRTHAQEPVRSAAGA